MLNQLNNPYFQPGLMMIASGLNIAGGAVALNNGAASKNEFFYFAFATSILYAVANGIKTAQIYSEGKKSFAKKGAFVDMVSAKGLQEIVISK